jgi:hypothetical protein
MMNGQDRIQMHSHTNTDTDTDTESDRPPRLENEWRKQLAAHGIESDEDVARCERIRDDIVSDLLAHDDLLGTAVTHEEFESVMSDQIRSFDPDKYLPPDHGPVIDDRDELKADLKNEVESCLNGESQAPIAVSIYSTPSRVDEIKDALKEHDQETISVADVDRAIQELEIRGVNMNTNTPGGRSPDPGAMLGGFAFDHGGGDGDEDGQEPADKQRNQNRTILSDAEGHKHEYDPARVVDIKSALKEHVQETISVADVDRAIKELQTEDEIRQANDE